jgi:hypothetical protein
LFGVGRGKSGGILFVHYLLIDYLASATYNENLWLMAFHRTLRFLLRGPERQSFTFQDQ